MYDNCNYAKPHIRIVNHKRFIAFVVICLIMITCVGNLILGLAGIGSTDAGSIDTTEYISYEIMQGQTLWNIAEMYMPGDMDTREAVFTLCKINDIKASDLKAGMTIQIPIYH